MPLTPTTVPPCPVCSSSRTPQFGGYAVIIVFAWCPVCRKSEEVDTWCDESARSYPPIPPFDPPAST